MASVTWAHYGLIEGNRISTIRGLILTLILAFLFTALQAYEYYNASFTIADGIYGSCFYFGTGLIYGAPFKINRKNTNYSKLDSPCFAGGFSDAESTFSIKIVKDKSRFLGLRIIPVYAIELHIRDIEVLKKIIF